MKKVGGKFFGEGTYGCAFSPSPACITDETTIGKVPSDKSKAIAKVFLKKQAMNVEWDLSKQIQKIDPKQKSFLYPLSQCDTTVAELKKDPDAARCSYTRSYKDPTILPMVKMTKGGMTLEKYVKKNNVSLTDFVGAVLPVLGGIRKLNKAKMVHNDLKFNNILYDPDTFETKIIDFGLMIPEKDAFDILKNVDVRSKYWLHPPEYLAESFVRNLPYFEYPVKRHARKIVADVMKMLDIFFDSTTKIRLKDTLVNKVFESYCEYEEEFTKYLLNGVLNKRRGQESIDYMTKYANKIDIYSLGISMMYLGDYLYFMSSKEEDKFYAVLKHFVHPDPRKRPGPTKAAKLLKSLVE